MLEVSILQNMKEKSVTIRAARIGGFCVIAAAGLSGLIYLFSSNGIIEKDIINISADKNINSPISGKIENQTNNYFQTDTNKIKKREDFQKNQVAPSNEKKTNLNSYNKGNNYIQNMSGGIAVGNVENLNINVAKEFIRETNGIYKNGEKWGVVKNININEKEKTFTIDEIKFDKSISNIDEVSTPFEYSKFILKITHTESLTIISPPSAKGAVGIIISEVSGTK